MMIQNKANLFVFSLLASSILSACNSDDNSSTDIPGIPSGVSYEQTISEPTLSGTDVTVVDGDIVNSNDKHNAEAYNEDYNPILQILSGFDDIYTMGDSTWSSDGASSLGTDTDAGVDGGATHSTSGALVANFSNAEVLDEAVWKENFDYVADLTEPNSDEADLDRSDPAVQVAAYLDDQREKGYSITSGLGPLADDYRDAADATSPYSATDTQAAAGEVDIDGTTITITGDTLYNKGLGSGGTNYGDDTDGDLSEVVTLLNDIRDGGASSEAPKYHFDSPRPWRINSNYSIQNFTTSTVSSDSYSVAFDSNIIDDTDALYQPVCTNLDDSTTTKYYETDRDKAIANPINGLVCAGRQIYSYDGSSSYSEGYDDSAESYYSSRGKDGAFPSGHTAEAFDRGLGMAYVMPARFAEMVARAADLGENRIVAGMHSPLDVIGGRIMGTAVTAAVLNNSDNAATVQAAVSQANAFFLSKASSAGYNSVYAYAHCTTDNDNPCSLDDDYADHDVIKARYKKYLTYGFTKLDEESADPEVPKGAEVLLATRLPYLDKNQRRAVLATTEIDSNYPVINKSRGWGRLNLVAAADGYGAFNGDVNLFMNASQGGFNAQDSWRNDISGIGRLKKSGTGVLTLEGDNSYSGGTYLTQGGLIAASQTAFGTNTLYQKAGTITVAIADGAEDSDKGELNISDYVQAGGTLTLDLTDNAEIVAENGIYLQGGALNLIVPKDANTTYTILSANKLEGSFTSGITVTDADGNSDYTATIAYTDTTATVTITPAD